MIYLIIKLCDVCKRSCFVSFQTVTTMLATYLSRFSAIADNKINCGPVLTWMEVSVLPVRGFAHYTLHFYCWRVV